MTDKIPLVSAVLASVIFCCALLVFGSIDPEYSHANQAISELGAFRAPNALAWNLVGFIIPGILLSICGATIALKTNRERDSLFWLLVFSGAGFAGAGVIPAEMQNGSPLMDSYWTIGHILMTFVSGFPWVMGAFLLALRVKNYFVRSSFGMVVNLLAVFAAAGLLLNMFAPAIPFFDENPGLSQRTAFAVYFTWFFIAGILFTFGKQEIK